MNSANTRIVEIVGVAGTGKTTLCRLLESSHGSIHPSNFPDVRELSNAPFFLWNGLLISPTLFQLSKDNSRNLTLREFAWLSILRGWPGVLQKELRDHQVVILDQGPVYLMTETAEFGPEYLQYKNATKFWQDLYSRWAGTLDAIVWLDAADSDLLERIRCREKEHVVKHESDETTLKFLARYRRSFERTISNLTATHPNLKVLRFDTSQKSSEEIVNQLMIEFGPALYLP